MEAIYQINWSRRSTKRQNPGEEEKSPCSTEGSDICDRFFFLSLVGICDPVNVLRYARKGCAAVKKPGVQGTLFSGVFGQIT